MIDIMILWILLIFSLEMNNKYTHFKIHPKNTPEIYSSQIMKINEYLGYIAWSEKYSYSIKDEINDAKDFLWELISKNPNKPEAYFKLWAIYLKEKKIEKCIDICERLFIEISEFTEKEYAYLSLPYNLLDLLSFFYFANLLSLLNISF